MAQLPTLGDGGELPLSAERRIGERVAKEIYRDPDRIDDPVLIEYVQDIWQRLLDAARLRGDLSPELAERFAWEVMLLRDRTVNAFALPGGYLGVHTGLINIVASRDELASVLAHELTHVTQRHIARLISRQGRTTPILVGAMLLGALAASRNPQAANAMIVGGSALATQSQLNFSRDMEREADRVGYGVMTQAGFDPRGFASMFAQLQQANRINDNGSFPYLRSHPLTSERIADVQIRDSVQQASAGRSVAMALDHAMVTARSRVFTNPGVDVLRAYLAEPAGAGFAALDAARRAGARYAAPLAGARLRDFSTARLMLARLREMTAADARAARQTTLLAAEIELLSGHAAASFELLRGHLTQRPELLLAAQAAVRSNQPPVIADLAERLQVRVALQPTDANAWLQLSSLRAAQGEPLRAIRAEAEARAAQLDFQAALDRLRAAQDMVRSPAAARAPADHIEASIIDSRLREVQSIVREQALER